MRLIAIILLICSSLASVAQNNDSVTDVNELFNFKIDSIERAITINKWGTDTSYSLHYTVTNISKNSLVYITNSCFYYNHYSLMLNHKEYDLNPDGGCFGNSPEFHSLLPGESFSKTESMEAVNIDDIQIGNWKCQITVPLVKQDWGYWVDGRNYPKNNLHLIFLGEVDVVENSYDLRKRKKRRKSVSFG